MKLLVLLWIAYGFNFAELCILKAGQKKDAEELNSLKNDESIEWNIFADVLAQLNLSSMHYVE